MENMIGTIWGYITAFALYTGLWAALVMGISGLMGYATPSEHRLKIGFTDD
jgi:hypothetical protein